MLSELIFCNHFFYMKVMYEEVQETDDAGMGSFEKSSSTKALFA